MDGPLFQEEATPDDSGKIDVVEKFWSFAISQPWLWLWLAITSICCCFELYRLSKIRIHRRSEIDIIQTP